MWYKLQELCVLWDSADSTGSRGTTALLLQGPTHTFWSILADLLLIYIYLQIILRGKTWQNHSQQKTLWPRPDCERKKGTSAWKKEILVKRKRSSWKETTTLQDHVWPQARLLDQLLFKEVRTYHNDHNIANSLCVWNIRSYMVKVSHRLTTKVWKCKTMRVDAGCIGGESSRNLGLVQSICSSYFCCLMAWRSKYPTSKGMWYARCNIWQKKEMVWDRYF